MFKSLTQGICNILLVGCLLYLSASWLISPSQANLDEIVYKQSLGNGNSIYGARDNRGGATVAFSYRYYISKEVEDDEQALKALKEINPFLITKNPDTSAQIVDGTFYLSTRGRIYEFSSYALENVQGASAIKVIMTL